MSWEEIPVLPSSSLSSPKEEEREEATVADFRWTPEFWDEPESAGLELVREDLLIAGQINVFPGLYEHGKTMVVGDLAVKWMQNHGPVLYLDWELGARRVKPRIKAHGMTADMLANRWHYRAYPQLKPMQLGHWCELLGPDLLVIIDSWHKLVASLGYSENDADSAGSWWGRELRPLTDQGVTLAVIAQTTKQGGDARGTVSTAFDSDVIWKVERMRKFTPERRGQIRLTLNKDREGVLPDRVGFELGGDGPNKISLTRMAEVPQGEPANEELLALVRDLLAGPEAESRGGLATTAIVNYIEGHGPGPIKTALDQLEQDGLVEHYVNTGTGGGVRWRLTDPNNPTPQRTAPDNAPSLD